MWVDKKGWWWPGLYGACRVWNKWMGLRATLTTELNGSLMDYVGQNTWGGKEKDQWIILCFWVEQLVVPFTRWGRQKWIAWRSSDRSSNQILFWTCYFRCLWHFLEEMSVHPYLFKSRIQGRVLASVYKFRRSLTI